MNDRQRLINADRVERRKRKRTDLDDILPANAARFWGRALKLGYTYEPGAAEDAEAKLVDAIALYNEECDAAGDEGHAISQKRRIETEAIIAAAEAEFNQINQPAFAELEAEYAYCNERVAEVHEEMRMRADAARARYNAIAQPAQAKYNEISERLGKQYQQVRKEALADTRRKQDEAKRKLRETEHFLRTGLRAATGANQDEAKSKQAETINFLRTALRRD